ncbi:MAG: hypothetical protein ACPHDR_04540 [Candidatus Puniceispirillaceae bacterium]
MKFSPTSVIKPVKLCLFLSFLLAMTGCQPLSVTGPVLSPPSEPVTASVPPDQIQGQTPEINSDKAIEEAPIEAREIASQTIVPVIPETPPQPPKISETPKEPEITEIDPRLFLDKSIEDIAVVLGPADFARIEGKMGIWQYRQTECVVDFFFYLEGADSPPIQRIAALDIRNRIIGQPLDEKNCREALYRRKL